MSDQSSILKVPFKSIYLPILAFAILCDTMPILGRNAYWVSVALVFFCLIYEIYALKTLNRQYLIWVISFCAFFLLSGVWALNFRLVQFVLAVRLLPLLIITFSVSMYLKRLDDLYDILKVFYIVAIMVLIYLIIFVDISSIEDRMSYGELGDNWNTNSIGIQFVFAIYIGFVLFWKKNILARGLFIIASLIMLYVVLITGSRKALIMFFIPILYFFLMNYNIKLTVKLALVVIGLGFVYIIFNVPFFYNIAGSRIMDLFNILSGNASGEEDASRLFLIIYGWEWFKEKIWLGYGINNYRVLSDATQMFAGRDFYAHNNYIELLVGVGIIGTLIYYSGYFYILIKALLQKSTFSKGIVALMFTLLFLDVAQVTYYLLLYMLPITMGFSAVSNNFNSKQQK